MEDPKKQMIAGLIVTAIGVVVFLLKTGIV